MHRGELLLLMSVQGHSRRFKREVGMTASPQSTDISSGDWLVRVVPQPAVSRCSIDCVEGRFIRSPRRREQGASVEFESRGP
jgi:hypothetical protein